MSGSPKAKKKVRVSIYFFLSSAIVGLFFLVKEDYHQFAFATGPEMIKLLCNEMHL